MKKFITLIAAIALILSMTAISVFAGNAALDTANGSQDIDVTARYEASSTPDTVYKVDVEWGAMEFTYTQGSQGTWDTTKHEYTGVGEAAWSGMDGTNNKITVTNHSNADVNVTVSFAKEESFTDLTAEVKGGAFTLESAAKSNAATTGSATLELSGAIPAGTNGKVGTLTVALG